MTRVKMTGFALGTSALAVFVPCATLAWPGESPETESLPLWLLGLFVTLMIFRIQAVLRGRQK